MSRRRKKTINPRFILWTKEDQRRFAEYVNRLYDKIDTMNAQIEMLAELIKFKRMQSAAGKKAAATKAAAAASEENHQ